jgi:thiamine pyrophosphate-dependent acetolactate synthase large subunit-like protein
MAGFLSMHTQELPDVYSAVEIARAAGLAKSAWADDEDDFERLFAAALKDGGPSLIAARIDDKPGAGATDRDPVQIRARFMQGLGVKRATGNS